MVEKCSFCGETIERGTGKFLVRRDGTLQWFCSSKCEKNHKLGRSPIKTRWTRTYRKFKGKLTKAEERKEVEAEAEKKAEAEKDEKEGKTKTPSFKESAEVKAEKEKVEGGKVEGSKKEEKPEKEKG